MLILKIIKHVYTLCIYSSLLEYNRALYVKLIKCAQLEGTQPENPLAGLLVNKRYIREISNEIMMLVYSILKKDQNLPEQGYDDFCDFFSNQEGYGAVKNKYFGSKYDDQLNKYAYVVFLFKQKLYVDFEFQTKYTIERMRKIYRKVYENHINSDKDNFIDFLDLLEPHELFLKLFYFFTEEIHALFRCDSESFRILFEPFISVLENGVNLLLEKVTNGEGEFFFSSGLFDIYEDKVFEPVLRHSKEEIETSKRLMNKIDQHIKLSLEEIIKEKSNYCIVRISDTIADQNQEFKENLLDLCQKNEFKVFEKKFPKYSGYLCIQLNVLKAYIQLS